MNELGEAIINQARIDMINEAVIKLGGAPISVESLAKFLPEDFCIDTDDLDGMFPRAPEVEHFEHVTAEPAPANLGNESAQREARARARVPQVETKGKPLFCDLLPEIETLEQSQDHLNRCNEHVAALQGRREALRRKVAVARDAMSRAVGAFQEHGQRSPVEVTQAFVKEQSEIRRAQIGTHGEVIRRQRAAAFVKKQMRNPGRGGLPEHVLMAKQIRELGHALPKSDARAAPVNKFGDR